MYLNRGIARKMSHTVKFCLLTSCLIPSAALAVDLERQMDIHASWINSFPIVVLGQFFIPEQETDPYKPRKVLTKFKVDVVIKGPRRTSINVNVHSDMLAYPGESISTYVKREKTLLKIHEDRIEIDRQMDALTDLMEENKIGRDEFEEKMSILETGVHKLNNEQMEIPDSVHYIVTHGETFYSAGGAITDKEQYLLAFESAESEFELGVGSNNLIYWGKDAVTLAELVEKM